MRRHNKPLVHSIGGYDRGCRCDICREAKSIARLAGRPRPSKLKLPYEPLVAALERTGQLQNLDPHRLYSWRKAGGIQVYYADQWAIKFGFHPAQIWGMDFYEGCFDGEETVRP
jgi:hypothetical protein